LPSVFARSLAEHRSLDQHDNTQLSDLGAEEIQLPVQVLSEVFVYTSFLRLSSMRMIYFCPGVSNDDQLNLAALLSKPLSEFCAGLPNEKALIAIG